jgi:hypothetical protein
LQHPSCCVILRTISRRPQDVVLGQGEEATMAEWFRTRGEVEKEEDI